MDNVSLALLASVSNLQDDFIVIFEGDDILFTNNSFNDFFAVSSTEHYNETYGDFIDNFVPHPHYFNKDKVKENENWIEALAKLDESDRIVSMLSQTYEPCAFDVSIDGSVDGYNVVVFKDITQDLIKRIMIQTNANIDEKVEHMPKNIFNKLQRHMKMPLYLMKK